MFKFIVTIVVLLVVVGGLWWSGLLSQWLPSVPKPEAFMGGPAATTTAQTPTPTPQQQQAVNDLPTQPNDASDSALAKDAAALDVQMEAMASDSTAAQNSLNDKPVTQEY